MDMVAFYTWGTRAIFASAGLALLILVLIDAPYGRHWREGWGPSITARLGWIIMELPSPIAFALVYATGDYAHTPLPLLFLVLYQAHYFNRTVIFPHLMKSGAEKRSSLVVIMIAVIFNTTNGALCGLGVSQFGDYDPSWFSDPRFGIGMILFVSGAAINIHSDSILRNLRKPGEADYKIPHGGLYRWISSPNYLGEIVEWLGFAIATWTTASFAFALFTAANLAPRAKSNQQWYHEHFPDYPADRRTLIPYIW